MALVIATSRVDYSGILAMARELAKYSPLPYQRITLLETASIVKICALQARIAGVAHIRRDAIAKAASGYTSPDGSIVTINSRRNKGRHWFAPADRREDPDRPYRGKGTVWFMVYAAGPGRGWHLSDFYWQAYLLAVNDREGFIKARIAELKRRRGSQRLSWIQIGDQIGVPLSTVSPSGNLQEVIARAARGPRGRIFQNGTATVRITSFAFSVHIRNASPLAYKNQGQAQLDRAVAQRLKGFEIAMKKGVLTDLKLRSARWKGIFVKAA